MSLVSVSISCLKMPKIICEPDFMIGKSWISLLWSIFFICVDKPTVKFQQGVNFINIYAQILRANRWEAFFGAQCLVNCAQIWQMADNFRLKFIIGFWTVKLVKLNGKFFAGTQLYAGVFSLGEQSLVKLTSDWSTKCTKKFQVYWVCRLNLDKYQRGIFFGHFWPFVKCAAFLVWLFLIIVI